MNILITGGAGFGGSGLIRKLVEHGHKVTALDIISPNSSYLVDLIDKGAITYWWKAVHDVTPYDVEGMDVVCNFAAQADVPMGFTSPRWSGLENVNGTIQLLEAVRQVKIGKFIQPSTGNVFGRPVYLPIDEKHPLTPHNPYSASKVAQEMYVWAYSRCYDIPVIVFRNGIVYGPGMRRDIFIYIWLKNLLQDKPIFIEGGKQTRDPCYVTDTVDAWATAVESKDESLIGEAFQISKGDEYSVEEIADKILSFFPQGVKVYKDYRPGEEGQRECFDISKAKNMLGYAPKVGLDEGLKLLLEDMQNDYYSSKP